MFSVHNISTTALSSMRIFSPRLDRPFDKIQPTHRTTSPRISSRRSNFRPFSFRWSAEIRATNHTVHTPNAKYRGCRVTSSQVSRDTRNSVISSARFFSFVSRFILDSVPAASPPPRKPVFIFFAARDKLATKYGKDTRDLGEAVRSFSQRNCTRSVLGVRWPSADRVYALPRISALSECSAQLTKFALFTTNLLSTNVDNL